MKKILLVIFGFGLFFFGRLTAQEEIATCLYGRCKNYEDGFSIFKIGNYVKLGNFINTKKNKKQEIADFELIKGFSIYDQMSETYYADVENKNILRIMNKDIVAFGKMGKNKDGNMCINKGYAFKFDFSQHQKINDNECKPIE